MNKNNLLPYTIVAIILITILGGQLITYYDNPYSCEIRAESGQIIKYSIDSTYGSEYTVASMESPRNFITDRYYIVFDEDFPESYLGLNVEDQVETIKREMQIYGIEFQTIDSHRANEIMLSDLGSKESHNAILFVSGYLNAELYDGTSDSTVLKWTKSGGVMYWCGGPIGKYIASGDGLIEVESYSELFFGVTDAVRDKNSTAYGRNLVDGSLTSNLSIYYNDCTFGLKTNALESNFMSLDYSHDGYAAVTLVQTGDGMTVVMGGASTRSMAQVIASDIAYDSKIIDCHKGIKERGQITGTLTPSNAYNTRVFIFLGELSTTDARTFLF